MRWRFSVRHKLTQANSIESKTMTASAVFHLWNSDHVLTWMDSRKKNIIRDSEHMKDAFTHLTIWAARIHLHEATITALGEAVAEVWVIHIIVQTANARYLNLRGLHSILIKFLLIGWLWTNNLSLYHLILNSQTSFKTASSSNRKWALPLYKIINAKMVIRERPIRKEEDSINSNQPLKSLLKSRVKVAFNSNPTTEGTQVGNATAVRTWVALGRQTATWWQMLVQLPLQWLIIW